MNAKQNYVILIVLSDLMIPKTFRYDQFLTKFYGYDIVCEVPKVFISENT